MSKCPHSQRTLFTIKIMTVINEKKLIRLKYSWIKIVSDLLFN